MKCAWLTLLAALCSAPAPDQRIERINRSLGRAAQYLVSRQDADGAWRSGVHGSFRDGPSLTPHVLSTLFYLSFEPDPARAAWRKGAQYLAQLVKDDDVPALSFPVYSAAEASWVAVLEERSAANLRVQQKWVSYLRARQLNCNLGWDERDVEFGGWGYAPTTPRKPEAGQPKHPLVASNLSATVFALGALRSAQVPATDSAYSDALHFVMRCQNFSEDRAKHDERFDDGGFFFQPGDAATNKAGIAGTDRLGRTRYHSYGSATCDGVRALLACGLPADHPRVVAARRWIEKNFTVRTNPGAWAPDRESIRDATYYYYCWSLAHGMRRLEIHEIDTPDGRVRWAEVLADELISRQRPDGSWKSDHTDAKEDDPLVSTPFAAAAVRICLEEISGNSLDSRHGRH